MDGGDVTVFHRVTEGKLGSHDGCVIEDEVSQEFLDRIPGACSATAQTMREPSTT